MHVCAIMIDNAIKNKKMIEVLAEKVKGQLTSFSEEMHVPLTKHSNLIYKLVFQTRLI